MTTTPEQLQACQEKFCTAFNIRLWELPPSGNFSSLGLGREWAGYLRCCQENEQAMKLAKFGAMVIRDDSKGSIDKREILQYAILADVTSPEVEATIKELLK